MQLSHIWNNVGPNIKLLQRFLFLLLSEIFTKLSFRSMQHSTFFSLPRFFRVGVKFFNVQKRPWVLLCILDASGSVMALQKCRVFFFMLAISSLLYFTTSLINATQTTQSMSVYATIVFFNTFKFLAKIYKRLRPHITASQERMWCMAAECNFLSESDRRLWCYAEHFLRVLNKAVNLTKPSWFSQPVYSGLVLNMLYVLYNMYINQQDAQNSCD